VAPAYRVGQFLRHLAPRRLDEGEWREVGQVLRQGELALFSRFGPADQRHSLEVMRSLRAGRPGDPDLLAAALLHDVGKTRIRLGVLERSLAVLIGGIAPGLARRWGRGQPAGLRKAFAARAQHADWGATMAQAAGSTARVVRLIQHHQDSHQPPLAAEEIEQLRLLRQADDLH
jgi:hypothetical protein